MEQYNSIKIQYLHELEIIIEFETPFEGNLNYDKYLCSYFYKWAQIIFHLEFLQGNTI